MNTNSLTPAALEESLATKLRELLSNLQWSSEVQVELNSAPYDRGHDMIAHFRIPDGPQIDLIVEIKKDPRPSQIPHVNINREFKGKKIDRITVRVFAAPHISPRMAEICENRGWSWFDLAGNCRISIPDVLHLQLNGNAPVHKTPRPKATLKTKEAARIVRALLSPGLFGMSWTQRSLQLWCRPEVSLGLVNKMVQYLLEESFISRSAEGKFQISDPTGLLLAWRDAYRIDQHERRGYFSPLHGTKLQQALAEFGEDTDDSPAAYAAFSAADFQAPHVRQPKTWLYLKSHELEEFKFIAEAKLVDSGENLVVLVPSDEGVFYQKETSASVDRLACTNPVQTYVDLWHCGGRGKEAAEAVLEQVIKPIWRAAGYTV